MVCYLNAFSAADHPGYARLDAIMAEGNPTIKRTTGTDAYLSRGISFCEQSHPMDELNDRPSFASPFERHGDVSATSTIHCQSTDAWTPNRPDGGSSPDREDTSVLVIDWDGPDDPNDPKK